MLVSRSATAVSLGRSATTKALPRPRDLQGAGPGWQDRLQPKAALWPFVAMPIRD